MTSLMELLESFNRKERFFLIGDALGNRTFQLSTDFRARLSKAFGIEPPSSAFVAMDYHLDWIHASLFRRYQSPDTMTRPLFFHDGQHYLVQLASLFCDQVDGMLFSSHSDPPFSIPVFNLFSWG